MFKAAVSGLTSQVCISFFNELKRCFNLFIDLVLTSPISVPFDALIRFFSVLG